MKKIKLAALLLLIAIAVTASSACSRCSHDYADGACSKCGEADPDYKAPCIHSYTDGVCTACGAACSHDYADGECSVCGIACAHNDYEEGVCTKCGIACTHDDYEEGVCTECGAACAHDYADGECIVCGIVCTHDDYKEGACTECGAEDPDYVPADGGASRYEPIITKFKELALYAETNGELPKKAANEPGYVDTLYEVLNGYDTEFEIGYALEDVDSDGYLELMLMGRDLKLYALFTIANKAPALVASFVKYSGPAYFCADGTVYFYGKTIDDNGAQIGVSYYVMKLVGGELVGFEYGRVDAGGTDKYYKVEDGVRTDITYDEYKVYINHKYEYYLSHPTVTAKYANLMFNPALDGEGNGPEITADFSSYDAIIKTFGLMYYDVTGGKFDKAAWRNGEYDFGMIFNSKADFALYNRLLGACVHLQGSATSSKYGYAIKDLNGDGTNELILMDSYGSGSSARYDIFAIFTQADGKPVLLDVYNDLRYACIDADGYVYVAERVLPGHSKDMMFTVYEIKDGELAPVSVYGYNCDYATSATQNNWYKIVDGTTIEIEKDEFDEFYNAQIKSKAATVSVSNFGKYNFNNAGITFVCVEESE